MWWFSWGCLLLLFYIFHSVVFLFYWGGFFNFILATRGCCSFNSRVPPSSLVLQNSSAQVFLYSTHLGEFQNKKKKETTQKKYTLCCQAEPYDIIISTPWIEDLFVYCLVRSLPLPVENLPFLESYVIRFTCVSCAGTFWGLKNKKKPRKSQSEDGALPSDS